MLKRMMVIGTVLLTALFTCLYLVQRSNQAMRAANLMELNTQVKQLQTQRSQLVHRLEEVQGLNETTENTDALPDGNPSAATDPVLVESNVVLCLNGMGEDFYENQYPVIQGTGIQGILIQKNGKLPGDNFQMAVADFLDLIQAGWTYAISMDREEAQNAEEWLNSVADYLDRLERRVSVLPTIYCFSDDSYDVEVLEGLKELGFTQILYHHGNTPDLTVDGLRQICLVDYQADLVALRQDGLSGFVGLEMWMNWTEETPEDLLYDQDTFLALTDDPEIHFQNMDILQENTIIAATEPTEDAADSNKVDMDQPDAIEQQIAEIDQKIRELYENAMP